MIVIDPSLASAKQLNLQKQIDLLEDYPYLHLDVEDGNFVPNITFGMKTISEVAAYTEKQLDAHLMVTDPDSYIDELINAGVKKIAFHIDAEKYPAVVLQHIRRRGGCAGLAFNEMASVELALPYIDKLDYLLIMTSEPDGEGQKYNPFLIHKIRQARKLFPPKISIMVDGGVSETTMKEVIEAGADTLVMGRAVWGAKNPAEKIRELIAQIN